MNRRSGPKLLQQEYAKLLSIIEKNVDKIFEDDDFCPRDQVFDAETLQQRGDWRQFVHYIDCHCIGSRNCPRLRKLFARDELDHVCKQLAVAKPVLPTHLRLAPGEETESCETIQFDEEYINSIKWQCVHRRFQSHIVPTLTSVWRLGGLDAKCAVLQTISTLSKDIRIKQQLMKPENGIVEMIQSFFLDDGGAWTVQSALTKCGVASSTTLCVKQAHAFYTLQGMLFDLFYDWAAENTNSAYHDSMVFAFPILVASLVNVRTLAHDAASKLQEAYRLKYITYGNVPQSWSTIEQDFFRTVVVSLAHFSCHDINLAKVFNSGPERLVTMKSQLLSNEYFGVIAEFTYAQDTQLRCHALEFVVCVWKDLVDELQQSPICGSFLDVLKSGFLCSSDFWTRNLSFQALFAQSDRYAKYKAGLDVENQDYRFFMDYVGQISLTEPPSVVMGKLFGLSQQLGALYASFASGEISSGALASRLVNLMVTSRSEAIFLIPIPIDATLLVSSASTASYRPRFCNQLK